MELQQFVGALGLDANRGIHTFDTEEWIGKELIFIIRQNSATERTDIVGVKPYKGKEDIVDEWDDKEEPDSGEAKESIDDILK